MHLLCNVWLNFLQCLKELHAMLVQSFCAACHHNIEVLTMSSLSQISVLEEEFMHIGWWSIQFKITISTIIHQLCMLKYSEDIQLILICDCCSHDLWNRTWKINSWSLISSDMINPTTNILLLVRMQVLSVGVRVWTPKSALWSDFLKCF